MSRPSRGRKRRRKTTSKVSDARLLRNHSDQLLVTHSSEILPGRAMLILLNGTGLATQLIAARPEVEWLLHTFEHLFVGSASESLMEATDIPDTTPIELFCTPDLPNEEVQTVILSTDSRGSGELLRDLVQSSLSRLAAGGRLLVSTNNPKDHWLHEHLKSVCGRVTVHRENRGVCYVARKSDTAGKQKSYTAEFAFRDGERLVACVSRPGVFSHRRVDGGARGLVRSLEHVTSPPASIVEMGCGCGAAAVAAAIRFPAATVLGIDSHARAVHSTELTADANKVANLAVRLTSDGVVPNAGTWDLFLCNPPYYSDFRISELFLQSALDALRPGGRVHLVTKLTDWHGSRMEELFNDVQTAEYGEYSVLMCRAGDRF